MAFSQFIIPFISLLTIVAIPLIQLSDSAGTKFDLIHRDRLPGCQHLTQADRITQMLYRDMIRMQRIQNNKQQHVIKRQTLEAAVTPIASGFDFGVGEYFAELMVGTPAKKFLVVADTGSDLTWVDCQYKWINQKPAKVIFDADKSTSFQTINCSSTTCKKDLSPLFSRSWCPQQNDSCLYNYTYGGESAAAQGIFAYETVTFDLTDGKTSAMNNTLIGCTNSRQGLESILTGANGIMGLGNSPFSLSNQASQLFGQVFSYCLVDLLSPNTTSSKLFLGLPSQGMPKINGTMQNTTLKLDKANSFYGVNVQGISIDGKFLNISADAWSFTDHGGTIIDSGSTLTYLLDSAYKPVINTLADSLSMFKNTTGPEGGPFELCYETNGFNDSAAPDLEIRFVGGAIFRVPGKSYLTDVADGVKCVGFVESTSGYNTIGNMLQQNNLWVFDVKNERLSFASSSCSN